MKKYIAIQGRHYSLTQFLGVVSISLQIKIQNFFQQHARYRGIPPVLIATFLPILPQIAKDDYIKWAGLGTIDLFMQFYVSVILIAATLGYMRLVYDKEWRGYWHWKKSYRYFHYFSFGFLGVCAAMIPYYCGVANFFFGMMNHELGGQITEYLPYLLAYGTFYSFIAADLFNSLVGKSIWFKLPQINRSPMKKHSYPI
jgi:hypothetical protein